jgi:acyl carrier protein
MQKQHREVVYSVLGSQLGVTANEFESAQDLRRDWGLTPLDLVGVLLALERLVALELPETELLEVETVEELVAKFRAWTRAREVSLGTLAPTHVAWMEPLRQRGRRARRQRELGRQQRELHHLHWRERELQVTERSNPKQA